MTELEAQEIIKDTSERPVRHVTARRLPKQLPQPSVGALNPNLRQSFQNERDPSNLSFTQRDVQVSVAGYEARENPVNQGMGLVLPDQSGDHQRVGILRS